MDKTTKALQNFFQCPDPYGSLSMPEYNAVAFEFDNAALMGEVFTGRVEMPDYSRVGNPTVAAYENKIKALSGAKAVTALNSGMAAISGILMALGRAGANIVTSRHVFGNTFALIDTTLRRWGLEGRYCDMTDADAVDALVDDNTCCLFLETVTNPQLEVADLRALSAVARRHNIPLVADTTMIPFTAMDCREVGVDVEVISSTKYLSGGATSLGGLIIDYGRFDWLNDVIKKEMVFNLGAYMTPRAAYMQLLGVETLAARYAVQSASAMALARDLESVPGIVSVNYPGLESNRWHQTAKSQFGDTYGAMLTVDLADRDAAFRFVNALKVVHRATNLFDNKSLAIHPASTIFGNFTPDERRAMDVLDTTVRLSIGLESTADLLEDFTQAARAAARL